MVTIEVNTTDSSSIDKMRISLIPGSDRCSMTVNFLSGSEYFYPSVPSATVMSIVLSESIGFEFNKLITRNKDILYARLDG